MPDKTTSRRRRAGIGSLVDATPASPPVSNATGPVEAEQPPAAPPQPEPEQQAPAAPEPAPAAPTEQPAAPAVPPQQAPAAPSANVPAVHVPPPFAPPAPPVPPPFGGPSFAPPQQPQMPQQPRPQGGPAAWGPPPKATYNVKHDTATYSLRLDKTSQAWLTTQVKIRVAAYELPPGSIAAKMGQLLIDNLHEIVRACVWEAHGYDIGPEQPADGGQPGHS